jgi:hypothetical protein
VIVTVVLLAPPGLLVALWRLKALSGKALAIGCVLMVVAAAIVTWDVSRSSSSTAAVGYVAVPVMWAVIAAGVVAADVLGSYTRGGHDA